MQESTTGAAAPELVTCEQTATAVVRGTVTMDGITEFFDRSFGALPPAIAAQGAAITGPAFGRYDGEPADTIDIEVGFTVDREIRPDGDVVPGSLPAGRAARLLHSGAFDGLDASWERLRAWIEGHGLTPATMRWECYVTEPTPDMDPRDLRVELTWPVSD
ncbi:effector-binding domain-containing protein [Murinocardiopsis flavida]|uniref:Effector-binding domain-containing protein n=1 Tax=Murinocardiopsis flavida TaxID=645275 RepID=A0A2P8DNN5_9ACTN|nr:GyrI-like domain-containing protein [Murinocardiopsis flavida]PSK98827.1 effector-binding domain-containing protein [Murinocardiopsis flavida]